jgi:hypothetical protein
MPVPVKKQLRTGPPLSLNPLDRRPAGEVERREGMPEPVRGEPSTQAKGFTNDAIEGADSEVVRVQQAPVTARKDKSLFPEQLRADSRTGRSVRFQSDRALVWPVGVGIFIAEHTFSTDPGVRSYRTGLLPWIMTARRC